MDVDETIKQILFYAQGKVKDKFRALNAAIQALQESQSGWTVSDTALRRHLRKAVYSMFVPKYKARPH